jgi:hypothetical protein
MSDGMDLTSLITGKNLVLAGGVFALTTTIRMSFKEFFKTRGGERLLPVLPIVLGVIGALMGICENVTTWQDKLMVGVIAGFTAGHLFKMGKTSMMGIGLPEKKGKEEIEEEPSPPAAGGGESGGDQGK